MSNPASEVLKNLNSTGDTSFLGLYQEYAVQVCDAPISFHQFVSYATIATALGNKVWFRFGDQRIFPHFWMILLAPSSVYHKSTAIAIAHRLLNRLSEDIVYPTEFSPEELMKILQDQPAGAFIFYEFMSFASYLERDYMVGTKSLLTEFYDSPPSRTRKIKKESYTVRYPAFCIYSGTTTDWFLEKVRERDMYAGFLPRFIFLPGTEKERDDSFPPAGDMLKHNMLLKKLKEISEISGEVSFTPDALKLHDKLYHEAVREMASQDSFLSAFYSRMQMNRLKFAVILEAGSNTAGFTQTLTVSSRSVQAAEHLVGFLTQKLRQIVEEEFVFTKFEGARKKVLNIIKQAGGGGVVRKDLLRGSHLSVRYLDDILKALFQEERVAKTKQKVEGSQKPSEFYHYQESQP